MDGTLILYVTLSSIGRPSQGAGTVQGTCKAIKNLIRNQPRWGY